MSNLLKDMEETAIENGILASDYWYLTFGEILDQVKVNQKIRFNKLREQADMDYRMAQLMAYAMNDPSKMPKFDEAYPFLIEKPSEEEAQATAEERAYQEMLAEQQQMRMMATMIEQTRRRKQLENKE